MSNTVQLQILFGTVSAALLPILVSYLKRCEWKPIYKSILSLVVAVLLGVVSTALAGKLTFEDTLTLVTTIYTASSLAYTAWFKGLAFNEWLERQQVL